MATDAWESWTTKSIIAGPGGVLTAEVGAITGDLTIHTTWTGSEAVLTVQYTEALDWYTVLGSPVAAADEHTAREIHQAMVVATKARGEARAPQTDAG